jgi:hypothetical protein
MPIEDSRKLVRRPAEFIEFRTFVIKVTRPINKPGSTDKFGVLARGRRGAHR